MVIVSKDVILPCCYKSGNIVIALDVMDLGVHSGKGSIHLHLTNTDKYLTASKVRLDSLANISAVNLKAETDHCGWSIA